MYAPPCHPESNGLTDRQIDKMIFSELASKVAFVKADWCGNCEIKRECLRQGFWTNEDNTRVALEGIYGGLTRKERKGLI